MTAATEFPTWLKDPLEIMMAHYFDPGLRSVKLRTLEWAIANYDDYVERVIGVPQMKEPLSRLELIEYLKMEVVFTVIQLCEDLVRIFETYKYSNLDPVQTFRSPIRATAFYRELGKRDLFYFANILSIPYSSEQTEGLLPLMGAFPSEMVHSLEGFQHFLLRVMNFYFKYLELYNYYKHGHRIAVLTTPSEKREPYAVILSLPEMGKRNTVVFNRVGKIEEVFELGKDIIHVASVAKQNWLLRRRDEPSGKFTFEIPAKKET